MLQEKDELSKFKIIVIATVTRSQRLYVRDSHDNYGVLWFAVSY